MKIGVFVFSTDESIRPAVLARAVEERGFESLWLPEHAHVPTSRETPYPLSADGTLPREYTRIYDPFVALSMAAAVTSTIKLGTGICLVSQREPIKLAKAVASLDRLSDGRFLFGIGAGWLREEMEALGTDFETRWKLTADRVAAMKACWTQDETQYVGDYAQIPPTSVYPKPVQKPHPPIFIGAASRWARQRVAEWADGWMPNYTKPEFLQKGIADLKARVSAAGRDPASVSVTVFGAPVQALDAYRELEVDRCILGLPYAEEAEVLKALDRCAEALLSGE